MGARGAAPEARDLGAAGSSTGSAPILTPLPADIPPVLERVTSCEAWKALGAKRGRIFGITRRSPRIIDTAVGEALEL
jgi:hypothetical protein